MRVELTLGLFECLPTTRDPVSQVVQLVLSCRKGTSALESLVCHSRSRLTSSDESARVLCLPANILQARPCLHVRRQSMREMSLYVVHLLLVRSRICQDPLMEFVDVV